MPHVINDDINGGVFEKVIEANASSYFTAV
jgi:hypothetical protein